MDGEEDSTCSCFHVLPLVPSGKEQDKEELAGLFHLHPAWLEEEGRVA